MQLLRLALVLALLTAPLFAGETKFVKPDSSTPIGSLPPLESIKTFKTPDDLKLDLVLSEPEITQPLFINFDERGRMWVVEYRQYPQPSGLTIVNHDAVWRSQYEKILSPRPTIFRARIAFRFTRIRRATAFTTSTRSSSMA